VPPHPVPASLRSPTPAGEAMTNVEAAATAIQADSRERGHWSTCEGYARAALEAIDPSGRLADLTPDDVTVILNIVHAALTVDMPPGWTWTFPQHVYEVLTR
jgi:hypothetical protein